MKQAVEFEWSTGDKVTIKPLKKQGTIRDLQVDRHGLHWAWVRYLKNDGELQARWFEFKDLDQPHAE